jgi:hypothetical protein
VLPNLHQNQDSTINFGTAAPKFMRICSVCLELLHVDTHNKTASSHLLFKLQVVFCVVQHAESCTPCEILEKQTDCTFGVTELVEVAVNRCAGKRCVSYVGMFDALRSNTATERSVTRHILTMPVFPDATPCRWKSGS